ncbi:tape measure protein [Dermabacter hominis]|uniref:tape measure protein n=1 Tax=Dermabacter hominis TaxID=36740 RepID=UPI0021A34AEA|nr:tape measure protein [Dermabacter hominis]MCT2056842.1 tape measure protein [Dermabacter hominis]MCT2084331.1 tape measure protein [Dermabacter hominis]MCT2091984.1 tape measure protein [Dermabacter hominis]MCT2190187.1 tape measure protein [Dermabacter hominis]MCT2227884.1 tape measure protein [Dermabacter hominis]
MAGYDLGKAYIQVIPSVDGAVPNLQKELEKSVTKTGKPTGSKLGSALITGLKGVGVAGFAAAGATFATSLAKGFGRLSAIENAEAKLKGLGHTTSEVEAITKNALNSVKGTAYGLDEAAGLAGNLVASGIKPGKDLERILKLVGDSAAISGREMSDMGLIWMQVASKGKLTGEDAMQLMEAGLPVWQMVGDQMNVTAAEAQDLASKGKVSFDVFAKAMEEKVGGAALASGNTTAGAFKNMNAALGRFGAEVLKGVFPLIGPMFKNLTVGIDAATKAVGPLVEAFSSRLVGVVKVVGDRVSAFKKVLATDWITPDLVKALGLDPSSGFGAVVQEAIGGVLAFKNAWVAFDGEVTSSGFPGFMEQLAFKTRSFVEWIGQNWKPVLGAVAGVAGAAAVKFGVFGKALAPLAAPAKSLFSALKPMAPLFRTLLGPIGLLGGAFGYLMVSSGEFRGAVLDLGAALGGALMSTIEALVPVVTGIGAALADVAPVLAGAILGALDALAPVLTTIVDGFSWLIGVLEPFLPLIVTVGGAIFGVVKVAGGLVAAFGGIQTVVSGVVAAVSGFATAAIPAVTGFVAAIGWIPLAIGAAIGALTWFFTQTKTGKAILSAVVDWITGTAWPAIQGAFKAIGDAGVWLWQNALVPAWEGIQGAIGAVVDWVTGSAVPFLKGAWDLVAGVAMWLWKSIIEPAWTGIRFAIAIAITAVMTYVDVWMAIFKNVVAPVFTWLWRSVIVPAWNGIRSAISAVVSWFQNTAWPILRTTIETIKLGFNLMRDALKAAWQFVKDRAIAPVVNWFKNVAWPLLGSAIDSVKTGFNVMRDSINRAWNFVKNRAIAPVVDWFTGTVWPKISGVIDNVKRGFGIMKDAVGKAWQGVKNAAIEPVNFVINKVYNEGIRSNFNSVAGKLGIPRDKQLPPFHGFARGGILPGFSRMRDGDDQLVPMRRGEGVLVSEALRTARDKAAFLAVNAAGRRGQGFADTVGFAAGGILDKAGFWGGGILDKAGQLAGDVLDGGKKMLKGAWDFVSDPVGAFKGLVGGLFKKIPGAGFFKDLALGVGRKILDGVVNKVSAAFSPASNPDAAPVKVPPGASRSLGYAQKVARSFGLTMTSFRRGGARTAGSGMVSLHALGRAMDFSNGVNTKQEMAFFNAMHPLKPTELLFSPAGSRQWRRSGRMADTSGVTKRMHYNHVHVGFAQGGIIPTSIIGGYKPYLHDNGGWHMPGKLSINQTQKPEAVLTARQWETVERSLNHATNSGMTINVTAPESQDPGVFGQRLGDALKLRQIAGSVA